MLNRVGLINIFNFVKEIIKKRHEAQRRKTEVIKILNPYGMSSSYFHLRSSIFRPFRAIY
jgi:hypothetical protein